MRNCRGMVGLVCIIVAAALLTICLGIYNMLAADYRLSKSYLRQRQCALAAVTALGALEGKISAGVAEGFVAELDEPVGTDDVMKVTLAVYKDQQVTWLAASAQNQELEVRAIKALVGLPQYTDNMYAHTLVSRSFNISSKALIEDNDLYNYATEKESFAGVNIIPYRRYAFVMPNAEQWHSGIGRNIFYDAQGTGVRLISNKTIAGSGVFVCAGDMTIGSGSTYTATTHFIATGNIIVERGAKLNQAFLLSGAAVKLSAGSYVCGKVFARNGIIVEDNVKVKKLLPESLMFATDRYLW